MKFHVRTSNVNHLMRESKYESFPVHGHQSTNLFRYVLNLQAEIKCRKNPLRYGYRSSSDEIHFPVNGIH